MLGVAQERDELRTYLMEMRDYMPSGHRAFVEAVERQSAIRAFVSGAGADHKPLVEAYNGCLEGVEAFSSIHMEFAASYIFKQAQSTCSNPNSVGTGGTSFMPYLKKHRDETVASQIGGWKSQTHKVPLVRPRLRPVRRRCLRRSTPRLSLKSHPYVRPITVSAPHRTASRTA